MNENRFSRSAGIAVWVVGSSLVALQAHAALLTLEPTGRITSGSQIENYFDGGQDSYQNAGNADPNGPNDEVIFPTVTSGFSTTYLDSTSAAKAANVPSGAADVFYQSVASTMNFAPGYGATSLSFEYSDTTTSTPTVTIYSGANGTGTKLQTLNLSQNSSAALGCPASGAGSYCKWTLDTASFSGVAESVIFGGTGIGQVDFDSITMNVVPVPATVALLLSGIGALGLMGRRRSTTASTRGYC